MMNKNDIIALAESEYDRLTSQSTKSIFESMTNNETDDEVIDEENEIDLETASVVQSRVPDYELDLAAEEDTSKIPGIFSREHVNVGGQNVSLTKPTEKQKKTTKDKPENPNIEIIPPESFGYVGVVYNPEVLANISVKTVSGEDLVSPDIINSDDQKGLKRLANKSIRSPEIFGNWRVVKPHNVYVNTNSLNGLGPTDVIYIISDNSTSDTVGIPFKFFELFYDIDTSTIEKGGMTLNKAIPKHTDDGELIFHVEKISSGYYALALERDDKKIILKVPASLVRFYEIY